MRFVWKGPWKKGEITIEASTLEELNSALDKISASSNSSETVIETGVHEFPNISGDLGCSGAIKALLESDWGKEPHSMVQIKQALEANALYFSDGALSGSLTMLTKGGKIRRFKKEGKWFYVAK